MTHAAPPSDVPDLGLGEHDEFALDPSTLDSVAARWDLLGSLVPFPGNPKIHTESAPEIATSVIRFGWGAPIIARRESRGIVGGHGRRLGAQLVIERWKSATTRERRTWHPDAVRVAMRGEVPVRLLDLDEHDARLLLIADNMIGERLSENDQEKLDALCRQLAAEGVELLGGTGLDEAYIKGLLAADGALGPVGTDPGATEPDDDENADSQAGEVYLLGPHRLMCGDATIAAHVQHLMAGERAVLCPTDPPYLVDYTGENHPQSFQREAAGKKNNKRWDKYKDPSASVDFFATFIQVALQHALIDAPAFYQWHASRRQAIVEEAWTRNGLLWHQQIIWVKKRPILTRSHYMWRHEPCAYGWVTGKPPAKRPPLGGENSTVWEIDQAGEFADEHPTIKPLEICERPIGFHTEVGDLVYEPFSGSGTCLIAAAKLGRRCYGMELSRGFCDVIRRRWTAYAKSAGIDPGPGALE